MKPIKRIAFYILLGIIYYYYSFLFLTFQAIFIDFHLTLIISFGTLNLLFAFLFLKWNILINCITAYLIAAISSLLVEFVGPLLITKLNLFPSSDPYGMFTAILTNAISLLFLWEIAYQLKIKFKKQRASPKMN